MPKPPNIVLIMADQLAPHFTGAYGHALVQTPHMQAWRRVDIALMPRIATRRSARRRGSRSCPGS